MWHKVNFRWCLTGLNSEFYVSKTGCHTKINEPSLPRYLSIAGERTVGFIPSLRLLVQCEIQTALSQVWTRVTVSIFNNEFPEWHDEYNNNINDIQGI